MTDRDPTDSDNWSNDRLETAYKESRAVLQAQQRAIGDIDDKATRAVRISVLLLGGLISAWRFAGPVFDAWLALWGGISLFFSLLFGVATYHESKLILGPTEEYLDDLNYRPERLRNGWEADIVDSYSGFIEANAGDIEFNADLLGQQVFLLEGLLLFGLAIVF
ncbi:hypothetical protein NGM10_14150 [Halorussus salilacus]|uniref:hypothetical protein n=1 Tax=Halorussus salilacus TaxID=2953750 RepID=UPI0020A216A4|nr:hypothetical protein [Halorussus salilacus]USZ67862.1 hypothetical protein NGM10_14150 [Halorussus salilacus]